MEAAGISLAAEGGTGDTVEANDLDHMNTNKGVDAGSLHFCSLHYCCIGLFAWKIGAAI